MVLNFKPPDEGAVRVTQQYSETPHEWDLFFPPQRHFWTPILTFHSSGSTYFQHLDLRWPLGENWAMEKTYRSTANGTYVFFFSSFLACSWLWGECGWSRDNFGRLLLRQTQTIGYKTGCCSLAARWKGGGISPIHLIPKAQVIYNVFAFKRDFIACFQ